MAFYILIGVIILGRFGQELAHEWIKNKETLTQWR